MRFLECYNALKLGLYSLGTSVISHTGNVSSMPHGDEDEEEKGLNDQANQIFQTSCAVAR